MIIGRAAGPLRRWLKKEKEAGEIGHLALELEQGREGPWVFWRKFEEENNSNSTELEPSLELGQIPGD